MGVGRREISRRRARLKNTMRHPPINSLQRQGCAAVSRRQGYSADSCVVNRSVTSIEETVPIRLSPKASRMLPFARVKLVVGRGVSVAHDPQQGAERVERIEPPVEAKREFIEVRL